VTLQFLAVRSAILATAWLLVLSMFINVYLFVSRTFLTHTHIVSKLSTMPVGDVVRPRVDLIAL